jgi:uncharacterized protein YfaP (DUF2135 family)
MSYPISPWTDSEERVSPDGRFRAVIEGAIEIAMGAPTSGTLVIAENNAAGRIHVQLESCNPSFVWSSDSRAVAVPQWTPIRQQRMCIVSVPSGKVRAIPGPFSVLELHAFEQGVVRGIDSPIYVPRNIAVPVEDLIE